MNVWHDSAGDIPPTIALFGLFGVGNIGNDSTLEALLCHLRMRLPEADLVCITPAYDVVAQQFDIPAVPMGGIEAPYVAPNGRIRRLFAKAGRRIPAEIRQWQTTAQDLQHIDQLIIVGTGALDDFGVSPTWIPYLLLRWCILARRAGAMVDFVSVGAGPIHNRLSRTFMLRALRTAGYRSYRDTVSRDYLESVGFATADDPICPDLVFSLPPEELSSYRRPGSPPHVVGIGVMGYYGWRNDQSQSQGEAIYQGYIAKLVEFAIWLLDRGYELRLMMGEFPTDERPIRDLLAALADHPAADNVAAPPVQSLDDVFGVIAQTDLVVATRFHNVLCSLMLGRPVVSIGYAAKNDALLTEMGLAGYGQHIETFDVARLQEQFLSLVSNHSAALHSIDATNHLYRQMLDRQYDRLFATSTESVQAVHAYT